MFHEPMFSVCIALFERLRQPAVAGEIVAGVLVGPGLLNLAAPTEITGILAEIGVIFLLFNVGLETKPAAILKVGTRAALVAALGVAVPFLGGWLLMNAWGTTGVKSLFVGTAMVATSVGITARVLSGMGLLDAPTARIILGAAVIDDILGLLVLAVVSSMAAGAVNYVEILTTAVLAIGFTAFVTLVGAPVITRFAPGVDRLRSGHGMFVLGLVLCLGLSVAAAHIGVAAIIGSFLAGMALAEAAEDHGQCPFGAFETVRCADAGEQSIERAPLACSTHIEVILSRPTLGCEGKFKAVQASKRDLPRLINQT